MTVTRDDSIVGRAAEVLVSDPWEFMSEVGTEPLLGEVRSLETNADQVTRVVVDLDRTVSYQGKQIETIVGTPRHRDSPTLDAVLNGAPLPVNMEGSPTSTEAAETRPLAFLGTIRLR